MQTIINAAIRIADFLHLYRLAARLAAVSYDREIASAREATSGLPTYPITSRRGGSR